MDKNKEKGGKQSKGTSRPRAGSHSSVSSLKSRRLSGATQLEQDIVEVSPLESLLPHSVIKQNSSVPIFAHIAIMSNFPTDAAATVLAYMTPLLTFSKGPNKVTGLTICQSQSVIQYLEGEMQHLSHVLEGISQDSGKGACPLSNVKVVGFSESCNRFFDSWQHVELSLPKDSTEVSDDGYTAVVAEIYANLTSVLTAIAEAAVEEVSPDALKHALGKLSTTHASKLPGDALLCTLCASAQVTSLKDFFDIYTFPSGIGCSFVDDHAWPAIDTIDDLKLLAFAS